jgi:hypothetical protein
VAIFFQIEAQSLEELRLAVCNALDLMMPPLPPGVIPQPMPEKGNYMPDSVKDMAAEKGNGKPRRAHRATAKPMPVDAPGEETDVPLTVLEPEDDPLTALEPEVEPEDEPGPDETPLTPVGLEALKKTVIDQLAGLFAAGKVKVVRHVLDKYGQGAKSFPEIDASHFPAIRDAIARGETT